MKKGGKKYKASGEKNISKKNNKKWILFLKY
jgi:hypothetical protein